MKRMILLILLASTNLIAASSNDEVEAIYNQVDAYYAASKNKERYNPSERQRLKKKAKQLEKYVEKNYEKIPIDIDQDMQKKDSAITKQSLDGLEEIGMFQGKSKKEIEEIKQYIETGKKCKK